MNDNKDLIKRLCGKYSLGPDGIREDRDFGNFTPKICREAAQVISNQDKKIEELEDFLGGYKMTYTHREMPWCIECGADNANGCTCVREYISKWTLCVDRMPEVGRVVVYTDSDDETMMYRIAPANRVHTLKDAIAWKQLSPPLGLLE